MSKFSTKTNLSTANFRGKKEQGTGKLLGVTHDLSVEEPTI